MISAKDVSNPKMDTAMKWTLECRPYSESIGEE